MKNALIAVCFMFAISNITAQSRQINSEVPQKIQTYVHKHFPNQTIAKYKKEIEARSTEYKVYLDNYVKLEFDGAFAPTEIKGPDLPLSVIPAKIADYVKANYPKLHIVEWEMKKTKQEVELNTKTELEFDLNGNFLRIDD